MFSSVLVAHRPAPRVLWKGWSGRGPAAVWKSRRKEAKSVRQPRCINAHACHETAPGHRRQYSEDSLPHPLLLSAIASPETPATTHSCTDVSPARARAVHHHTSIVTTLARSDRFNRDIVYLQFRQCCSVLCVRAVSEVNGCAYSRMSRRTVHTLQQYTTLK